MIRKVLRVREENGKVIRFLFHREELLAESDKEGNPVTRLIRGVGAEACEQEEKLYYYHKDELGIPDQVRDSPVKGPQSFKYIIECHNKILLYLFWTIIKDSARKFGSGRVGAGKEFIPGSMNLHELPRIRHDTADGKTVRKGKPKGIDPFLPMFFELPDDVFDIVLVNQDISFHDRNRGIPVFDTTKDSLLIFKSYLGIRNQKRGKKCMRCSALLAPYALNVKVVVEYK